MKKKLLLLALFFLWEVPVSEMLSEVSGIDSFASGGEAFAQYVDTTWVRRYNGPGNSTDEARSIAVDDSGNAYITGNSMGSGSVRDYATIKYYPNGDTAWVSRFNGSDNYYDAAYAVAVDNSINIYVTGWSWNGLPSSGSDYVTIKYNPDGDTVWVRTFQEGMALALAVDSSGNSYVTGLHEGTPLYNHEYVTIKYYPNGGTAWYRTYNGSGDTSDIGRAISVDGSGNVYVTGYSKGGGTGYDYATIKYNPNGDTAWLRRYNGPGNSTDLPWDIATDGSENVYVTGSSRGSGTYADYATIKYYPNGDTAWVRRYDGPADTTDVAYSVAVDSSGYIYLTGRSIGSGTSSDYATIKYDLNGNELWVKRYNGPGNNWDEAWALALDSSGNAFVTGASDGSGTSSDYATIKYYSNGDTAWVRRYNGPADTADIAYCIVADGSNNVYVTGYSWGSGTNYDYATIKYYPNGDTAWVRRYNGLGNSDDEAFFIDVDDSGNVYVTGWSYGSGTDYDYATIKYYPNGDIAWVRRYNGPGNSGDWGYSIAVDGSGNVYVTGWSYGSGTDYDYATIKYLGFPYRNDTLIITAYSPVDLIITDPNADSIGVNFNFIPNATYDTTIDKNSDGDLDDIVTIPNPIVGDYMVKVKAEPDADTGHYSLTIKLDNNEDKPLAQNLPIPPPDQVDTYTYSVIEYLRGDANTDKKTTVSDVIYLINYLFKGGPAPNPVNLGDVNYCQCPIPQDCDGKVTVSDVVYLINYLFKGGPAPCS